MSDAVLLVVLTVLATLLAERVIKRTLVHLAAAWFMRWLSRRAEEAERKQAVEMATWLQNVSKALFWRLAWARAEEVAREKLLKDDDALPEWRKRARRAEIATKHHRTISTAGPGSDA